MQDYAPAATRAEVRPLSTQDLLAVLALGWADFKRAPLYGLFFASVYVAGGWIIVYALTSSGKLWWTLPAAAGFPILGPFLACGLYEVSRALEDGEPLHWRNVLGVVLDQKDRQIPSMAVVIVVFFLFWNFLAHMIFALFMGLSVMTNITSSFEVYFTTNGVLMLTIGTIVGAIFAGVLFSLTVISLPMLLDREVDFVTAMITSVAVVITNPGIMLLWGGIIAISLFASMGVGFLGLFIAMPVLGHASWHLYRRALD